MDSSREELHGVIDIFEDVICVKEYWLCPGWLDGNIVAYCTIKILK